MADPKALVLRAAGTNCDRETVFALSRAGFDARSVHVFELLDEPRRLREYRFLVVPGGFSYGDDVSAGKILANQLVHHLADELNAFVEADKLVLGICNGFQVLLKSGLLPWGRVGEADATAEATLAWSDSGHFEDRWVHLRGDSSNCVFLPAGEVIYLPIANGEGKFVPRDEALLERLRQADAVALRYTDAAGNGGGAANPNGSVDGIAGLCDPTGRILGLMPHPERFVDVTQHPRWTRGGVDRADGALLLTHARKALG